MVLCVHVIPSVSYMRLMVTAAAAAKPLQSCLTVQPHRLQPTGLPRRWDSLGKNTRVGCHFLLQCLKVKNESEVTQSCPTLSEPVDCSPPGSSVRGIFQARALEWGAMAFSGLVVMSYEHAKHGCVCVTSWLFGAVTHIKVRPPASPWSLLRPFALAYLAPFPPVGRRGASLQVESGQAPLVSMPLGRAVRMEPLPPAQETAGGAVASGRVEDRP